MSLNFFGGALGVTALVAILYLHGCKDESPKLAPVPQVTATVKKPTSAVKPTQSPGGVYRRVTKGGKLDGTITCKAVTDYVAGKTQAQLDALAKEYNVSAAQLAQYKACIR